MINSIQKLGYYGVDFLNKIGQSGIFLLKTISSKPKYNKFISLTIEQIYYIGVLSLLIIVLSALFIGMVVSLQGFHTLQKFSAEQELGQLISLSVVRELGPVVTALLFAGRAGSALTAEIGLMHATEQLSCMEMMAVNPLARIVAPRFWGGIISMPILAVLFNITAIYGGYLVGVKWLGVDSGAFWSNMQQSVSFSADILNGIIKSVVFGFIITWVAVYQGFFCEPNAAGISRATTKTVVYSSLMILGMDFILTTVMMGGW